MAKRVLLWALIGAALGDLAGVLLGGKMISYWVRPPGVTDQDRCVVEVDAALGELAKVQGVAALIGLVIFVIACLGWSRKRSSSATAEVGVK